MNLVAHTDEHLADEVADLRARLDEANETDNTITIFLVPEFWPSMTTRPIARTKTPSLSLLELSLCRFPQS
jgi:hypothetical protein